MTNLINIAFAAVLVTNSWQYESYQNWDAAPFDWRRDRTTTDTHIITSNWTAQVSIDGKTNAITLHTVTNHSWTVETKMELVSRTNGNPPMESVKFIVGQTNFIYFKPKL